ncbi:hypothetical protein EB796_016556 [Bugula neritina]|uniref:CASP2 n=1 Tax=Bugula neritina TaxID=10212 RepID=A0A7J7JHX5_BUGNE|nr:hypothetical protein EB796_016556 [Bugula neritina]
MFFLFLFAHGANGMIHGVDSQPVYLTQIYSLINSTNFPNMACKPMVVVIQACRVGNSVSQTEQNIQQSTNFFLPELSALRSHQQEAETSTGRKDFDVDDLLILHSCFENSVSMKFRDGGSLLLRILVKTLYRHACHPDLAELFDIVSNFIFNESLFIVLSVV